ncbi:unnamed protein product [Dicrocoelium dendriticum]|nr:unnamed protein product [Dicrocoelium dendriticum]
MPVWSFAKKSVKIFLNFAFGQFFSQPLCDSQIFISPSGFGCKDLYFNTEKINALFVERKIPIVVCVAYVSELLLSLPSCVIINGIDLVLQTASNDYHSTKDSKLFSSMFSSVTAAAFAAAKVADCSADWLTLHDEESEDELISSDEGDRAEKVESGWLFSRIQKLFERLTKTAEKVDLEPSAEGSFLDRKSKQRVAYMIDSVIAQTTVVLRKVNIRIECQLGLPGLNRASGLALSFEVLSITNQYGKTSDDQNQKQEHLRTGRSTSNDGWFWLWRWGTSDKSAPFSQGETAPAVPVGSLSTTLHKTVRLEGADLFWDLWNTTEQVNHQESIHEEQPNSGPNDFRDESHYVGCTEAVSKSITVCPTEDNMIASARLLSLTGVHTAHLSIRCPVFSCLQSKSGGQSLGSPGDAMEFNPWSVFELRVHLDLGPIVACMCPSQFYWLRLLFGQMSYIWQAYAARGRTVQRLNDSARKSPQVSQLERSLEPSVDRFSVLNRHVSTGHMEENLVDLDLSNPNESLSSTPHPLVDSKLFWSCVTNASEPALSDSTIQQIGIPSSSRSGGSSEPRFSLSANVLCVSLIAFYEDDSVSLADPSIPCHVDSDLCKSVGPASRLSHLGHLSSRTKLKPSSSSEGDITSGDETFCEPPDLGPTLNEFAGDHSEAPSEPSLPNLRSLAVLPGPFLFFSRFAGLLPWRQPSPSPEPDVVPVHCGKPQHTMTAALGHDDNATAIPMRIDRTAVDTGQMSPACWAAHLRRQFAELASPRDHICFVGGLWHFDICLRSSSVHSNRDNQLQDSSFSAQLFAIELSECLFQDPSIMESGDARLIGLLTFPDRQRILGDSAARDISDNPAATFNGFLSVPASSLSLSDSLNLNLAHCHIDVDISLSDRIHRIADGLTAASEALVKFFPPNSPDLGACPWWHTIGLRSNRSHVSPPNTTRHSQRDSHDSCFRSQLPFLIVDSSTAYCLEGDTINPRSTDISSRLSCNVSCVSFEILLRFPIPLEAVSLDASHKLSDLHTKLWRMGVPVRRDESATTPSDTANHPDHTPILAWWRRSLRPEHLRFLISKVTLTCHVPFLSKISTCESERIVKNQPISGRNSTPATKFKGTKTSVQAEVQLTLRLLSIHLVSALSTLQTAPFLQITSNPNSGDLIKVTILLAPFGRQALVEDGAADFRFDMEATEPVHTFSHQRFEMGVDLATMASPLSLSGPSFSGKSEWTPNRPVEWSLWSHTGPKQNPRTPFVIRRNFLQDAPNTHSKQLTYYPGDAGHLAFFRQTAGAHARFSVHCKSSIAVVHIEHKQTMEVLRLRLFYDLFLWTSLLPNDRRLRATLTRHRSAANSGATALRSDHRYWFLSDPAPLASIYAHPDAAREAAALELTSLGTNTRHPSGLHFHPFYSEDEEETDDDKASVFDAGLDSFQSRRLNPRIRRWSPHSRSGSDADDDVDPKATTAVQKQSFLSLQVDIDTVEFRITLPALPSDDSTTELVQLDASGVTLFLESAHNGCPELNHFTMECNRIETFFTAHQSTAHFNAASDGVDAGHSTWWPGLVYFSWQSAGYPVSQSCSSEADSGLCTLNGPMFTMAVEHRQLVQTSVPRDEFHCAFRLQDACLVHWPHLEGRSRPDDALPVWLRGLLQIFQTPSAPLLNQLLPGYQPPETLLVQHFHLERVALTWSAQYADPPSTLNHSAFHVESVRAFLGCESIGVTVNTASETSPINEPHATGSSGPGTLIMTFLDNATLFLCPNYRKSIGTPEPKTTASPSSRFLKWIGSLRLADCVCVADLDHLEVRCFSYPTRVSQRINSKVPQSFINRIDIRATDNLLRLNTCADSLVALQSLVEALTKVPIYENASTTPLDSNLYNEQTNAPYMHSPKADFLKTVGFTDQSRTPIPCPTKPSSDICSSGLHLDRSTVFEKNRSPEPRPCLTPHSDRRLRGSASTNILSGRLTTVSRTNTFLSPPDVRCHDTKPNHYDQLSSPSSLSRDFVVIKSSMLPSNLLCPVGSKVEFKWLVPSCMGEAETFELRENQYPSPCESALAGSRNRMRRLFTDPTSVYPPAILALTLYNCCLEWNLFGGTDIASFTNQNPRVSSRTVPAKSSEHTTGRPCLSSEQRNSDLAVDPAHVSTARSVANTNDAVKKTYRFRHDRSAMGTASSQRLTFSGSTGASELQHQTESKDASCSSMRGLHNRGGQFRDTQKHISVRLSNVYFRHATFPTNVVDMDSHADIAARHCSVGEPAIRCIFNIGSVLVLDRVATSNINQLLYSYNKSSTDSSVAHNGTPIFRMSIMSWRVPVPQSSISASPCKGGAENEETDIITITGPHRKSVPLCPAMSPSSLELEAKISCQPLRINLDQNTLLFLEEFQTLLSSCASGAEFADNSTTACSSTPPSTSTSSSPRRDSDNKLTRTSDSADEATRKCIPRITARTPSNLPTTSLTTTRSIAPLALQPVEYQRPPNIFIRKVTFYPDLPIRLDYHGRNLEWNSGSMHGFLRTLLQLHNAELVIPRRVYQRGYPSLERLLEEVSADIRDILVSQLPQMLATCIGPMHEVTQFLMGLWDLVYQPMYSLYMGSRTSSDSLLEVQRGYWRTADLDMSTYDTGIGSYTSKKTIYEPESGGGFIHGLRHGTRSFSTSTLWATLQLSIQGIRAVQSVAETAYDLLTPGPSLRSRQLRLRQPADLREGFGNAVNAMSRGLQMVTEDLFGATRVSSDVDLGCKGPVGVIGDVIRQIPPTIVTPLVTGCEVTANILGGFRNQIRPEAKLEDEQKWKDTHGL